MGWVRRLGRRLPWLVMALCLLWTLALLPPGQRPGEGYGTLKDRVILAADGRELAGLASRQRRAGPWLGPGEVPPLLAAAAVAAEDQHFWVHPGVDPGALARATYQNLAAGRVVSGGSTISMQLARLLDPGPRTLGRKLYEAWRALWLEARLGKAGVLRQYLNRAPLGGPLVGVGAASRQLFNQVPAALSPAQAATLLALPQDPSRLLRPNQRGRLRARRDRILTRMAAAGDLSAQELTQALATPLTLTPPPPDHPAPHFAAALARAIPTDAPHQLATYLDPALQLAVGQLVAAHARRHADQGLRQAAALVLRNSDGAVLTWVGSPDFDEPLTGQVDGVLALRQPGSALKPFIYALALEKGHTLNQVLDDGPLSLVTAGGAFRPSDYDHQHRGAVRLRVALGSSLNLPALRLAAELDREELIRRLRALGLELPLEAQHYGLGLVLGNGEVNLLHLTTAYAALARGGLMLPPRLWLGQTPATPERVLDARSAWLVGHVLADDHARAPGFGRHSLLELPFPAAVKTGTSQRHRDNWCVGYTDRYTVGVWVGNFQGDPMAGMAALRGAGPLWRDIMLLVHRDAPGALPPRPAGLVARAVCPLSGQTPGPGCPGAVEELLPVEAPPPPTCALHEAPLVARAPGAPDRLELVAPLDGAVYALDPDLPAASQILQCQLRGDVGAGQISWRLNGQGLAGGPGGTGPRLRLAPGRFRLEAVAADGRRARADFVVLGGG